jgi:undecaprenyl-diphosphatase
MSLLEALILGIVQGLTEFLPISSNAHLRIVPELLGWPEPGAAFTAVIQLGTLTAVLWYFRGDVARLFAGFVGDVRALRYGTSRDAELAWMIAGGTVPVVIGGLLFKKQIEGELRRLDVIACAAIGFALLLGLAELLAARRRRHGDPGRGEAEIGWRDALLVGLFQALALIPGASRSGVTITAGLLAGLSRPTAARFSFLLSLPAVFAAGVYELYKERDALLASQGHVLNLVVASVIAGIVGYWSIAFLLNFLKRYSTAVFIVYRIMLGGVILVLLAQGMLTPYPAQQTAR